ncbi:MAG: PadR family transcriptional regulator [Herbiconiux sp.]|nr:PadR family transcriptional regulator [Herbiconiux sp.]
MTTDVGAQLRKGVVEYCVLGLLQQGPAYGWSISQRLVSLGLIGGIGTLYPLLARLRSQRLIVAHAEGAADGADEADGARPRKYYTLTAEGRAQLEAFRAQWHPFVSAVSAITDPAEPGAPDAADPGKTVSANADPTNTDPITTDPAAPLTDDPHEEKSAS